MGDTTGIAWTDHTFNPWWGCTKVSAACDHCYAEGMAKRTGHTVWGKGTPRRRLSERNWLGPLRWQADAKAAGRPALVFCASMADVFEGRDDLDPDRARLWELIEQTPDLIWQLLTKRPEQVARRVPRRWLVEPGNLLCETCGGSASLPLGASCPDHQPRPTGWPANVWLGTTVEHQEAANLRIPRLLELPAPVRFLSCEPLLGPVDLSPWLPIEWMDALRPPDAPLSFRGEGGWGYEMFAALRGDTPPIRWVIIGGESGGHHRPLDLGHARDLADQVKAAEVPLFFKQVGGSTPTAGGDRLDGRVVKQFPPSARRETTTPVRL